MKPTETRICSTVHPHFLSPPYCAPPLGAAIAPAQTDSFHRMGAFMMLVMVYAWIYSILFFAPMVSILDQIQKKMGEKRFFIFLFFSTFFLMGKNRFVVGESIACILERFFCFLSCFFSLACLSPSFHPFSISVFVLASSTL